MNKIASFLASARLLRGGTYCGLIKFMASEVENHFISPQKTVGVHSVNFRINLFHVLELYGTLKIFCTYFVKSTSVLSRIKTVM